MEMEVQIKGMDELPGLVAERVQGDGLSAMARVVRDEAKQTVPVKTGKLRDSIRARRRAAKVDTGRGVKRVPGAAAQTLAGGPGARHAHLIELGTVKAAARPYLEPALLATQDKQLSAAAAAMARSFVRIGKQLAAGTPTRIVRRLAAG